MTPKRSKGIFTYILVIAIAFFCIYFVTSKMGTSAEKTEYTEVISHFDNYEVSYYELDLGSGELIYKLRGRKSPQKIHRPQRFGFL